MKATFEQIAENLVKVFENKEEFSTYCSDAEQYQGICGWCGVMSPLTRAAYYKEFGKDTTDAAEARAREIIAAKEAARKRTKYYEHAQEADRLEGVPAVGGFFWADNSGLKCDGGKGIFDELHALTFYTHAEDKPARLCYVEEVINVSEEDFSRPELADELVQSHELKGGFCSDDVPDEEYMAATSDPEKLATFYTVGALVVSPSGKYYLIDAEGYSYARYIYVPIEWPALFADEVEHIKEEEKAREAEAARKAAEAKAQRLAEYRERCKKWAHLMRDVRPLEADKKTTERKLINARKANILAMCRAAFPGVKFSLKVRHGWGADFDLSWVDGPTEEDFHEKTDLDLFCSRRDTFNGWDDSTDVIYAEFTNFARFTMGSNSGDIDTAREMSDEARDEILAKIFAVVPEANNRNKYGYLQNCTYTNTEAEAVATALGFNDVCTLFPCGYNENAETIARIVWDKRSYTPTTPEPTDPKPGKAQAADTNTDTTDEAPAEGLELVEIAEGVAVVGDSRTTYRNRKAIKAHGALWNKTAQQWQATDTESVQTLREWFGVNDTPTAEEDSTADENDSTTPETGEGATLCEVGKITEAAQTATAEDSEPCTSAHRLALLRVAADNFDKFTKDGEHVSAMLARLDALLSCGVDVADLIKDIDYTSDYYARQRAAVVLTPEEFRTLYGYNPNEHPSECTKVWQFERGTKGAADYERHEIRECGGVFSVIFNLCELYPDVGPFSVSFNSYTEAAKALARFRPGVRVVSTPENVTGQAAGF